MHPLALNGNAKLAAAVIIGIMVGVWLVKSSLDQREKIVNMLLLKEGLALKVFFFSVAIGSVLFFIGHKAGYEDLHIRKAYFWGSLIGGVIAGLGVTICGRIPITAVASLATGKVFSLWVILGFLLAFPAVSVMSGFLSDTIYSWSRPVEYHNELDGYMSLNSAILWTVGVCLILTFILQFTLGKDTKDE